MTEKEIKKLSRADLLQLLLEQSIENDRLTEKVTELEEQLARRELHMQNAGSLAEAVMLINGVFDSANAAAEQYLYNLKLMHGDVPSTEDGDVQPKDNGEAQPVQGDDVQPAENNNGVAGDGTDPAEPLSKSEAGQTQAAEKCRLLEKQTAEKCRLLEEQTAEKCRLLEKAASERCSAIETECAAKCAESEDAAKKQCDKMKEDTARECAELVKRAKSAIDEYKKTRLAVSDNGEKREGE